MRRIACSCLVASTLWSATGHAQTPAAPGAAIGQPADPSGEPPPLPPPDPLPPPPPAPPGAAPPGSLAPPPPPPATAPAPGGYPPPQYGQRGYAGQPPPPPRKKRPYGFHRHDGFYLRIGIGLGSASEDITESDRGGNPGITEQSSISVPVELALGGTLGAGFVLGFGINGGTITPSDRSTLPMPSNKHDQHHSATMIVMGPMVDWYIDPKDGFHVQGMIGASALSLDANADSDYAPAGWGFSLGGGKEWWVGDEGSMGVLARVDVTKLSYDEESADRHFDHDVVQIGVLATFTYH